MSAHIPCTCPKDRRRWVVGVRLGNRSAFNGYRWTPSRYSAVRCEECRGTWRTAARYVASLPDAA